MIAILLALAAVPPLPPFPTEVRPRDGTTAPENAALFFLGDPAPNASAVGVSVTAGGITMSTSSETIGCCVVRTQIAVPGPVEGDVVVVNLTSAAGDASATWTAGPTDTIAPTFTAAPSVLDHGLRGGVYEIVIGVDVADDTQIGMVTAEYEGALVGVTVDGFILRARLPADVAPGAHCVSLVAHDVTGNITVPAEEACVTVVAEPAEGEGEGEPPPGCGATSTGTPSTATPWALALVLLALRTRRTRARLDAPPTS